jgi:hypothetical protein
VLKQVQYLLKNNWTPCVEFDFPENSISKPGYSTGMDSSASAGYYTNRYWVMWKLPMYGATDADSVLAECKKAAKAFPSAFVRLAGFDANRQARARRPAHRALPACAARAPRRALAAPGRRGTQGLNPTIGSDPRCCPPASPHRALRPTGAGGVLHCAPPGWRRGSGPVRPPGPGLSGSLLLLLLRSRTRAGARQHPRELAACRSAADALLPHLCSYAF